MNENPLHVVNFSGVSEAEVATMYVSHMSLVCKCRLCKISLMDTATIQLHDKHCITIKNLMEDNLSKFPEKER